MAPEGSPSRQLLAINPYFLVNDVFATAEHYRDVFGFRFDQFWGEPPRFVMDMRDGLQIMLRQPDVTVPGGIMRPNRSAIAFSFDAYVYVADADALYAELQSRGAKLLGEPCTQPHDCREFEVEDMNGYVLCFGQDLISQ